MMRGALSGCAPSARTAVGLVVEGREVNAYLAPGKLPEHDLTCRK